MTIFYLPKVLWERHLIEIFFSSQKIFTLWLEHREACKLKSASVRLKTFLKDIFWNKENFVSQNPYGYKTIWSSFSDDFFDRSKSLSTLAKKSRLHHMKTSIWEFVLRFSRKDVGRVFRLIIKLFQTDQKIANASNNDVYQRICANICSEGRLQEKCALSPYGQGRQQNVSMFHWLDPPRGGFGGREPPQGVDPLPSW